MNIIVWSKIHFLIIFNGNEVVFSFLKKLMDFLKNGFFRKKGGLTLFSWTNVSELVLLMQFLQLKLL